jgi:hypothetical protein
MINTTRWSPDTCKCVLEYTWDDSIPEDQRVHTPANIVFKCDKHIIVDSSTIYDSVKDENQTKNQVLATIAEELPEFAVITTDKQGVTTKTPDLEKIVWDFNENRKLHVGLVGVKETDRVAIEGLVATQFPDKVFIPKLDESPVLAEKATELGITQIIAEK